MKRNEDKPRMICEIDNFKFQDLIKGKREDYHKVYFYGCPNEKVYAIYSRVETSHMPNIRWKEMGL